MSKMSPNTRRIGKAGTPEPVVPPPDARFFSFAEERWLPELPAPAAALREPDGLLAAGGALDTPTLLAAYARGIFPWYSRGQPILWWSPDPRTVFLPASFHVSRSLARTLRRGEFELTLDRDFVGVMRACGPERRGESSTWITPAMLQAYTRLHAEGHAHSVECWRAGELVGGVYGVAIGQVFFGESMFSRATDASKVALATLCHALRGWGYELVDCQMASAHLSSLGAVSLPRPQFCELLAALIPESPSATAWLTLAESPTR